MDGYMDEWMDKWMNGQITREIRELLDILIYRVMKHLL